MKKNIIACKSILTIFNLKIFYLIHTKFWSTSSNIITDFIDEETRIKVSKNLFNIIQIENGQISLWNPVLRGTESSFLSIVLQNHCVSEPHRELNYTWLLSYIALITLLREHTT
jgi:hypothetical protein